MGVLTNLEVFGRRFGELALIDSSSDADLILQKFQKEENGMLFRLMYQGELKSASGNNRAKDKWAIRHALSPQLQELWQVHHALSGYVGVAEDDDYTPDGYLKKSTKEQDQASTARRAAALRVPTQVGAMKFLPLVKKSLDLVCSLDILFLRKDPGSSVVSNGGDLDNRLKVLFDGLRMPTLDEVGTQADDGKVIYCLTEDDALISDFSVKTDRLLTKPDAAPSEVILVMEVNIRTVRMNNNNLHIKWGD